MQTERNKGVASEIRDRAAEYAIERVAEEDYIGFEGKCNREEIES
jgi:hypothetical protein